MKRQMVFVAVPPCPYRTVRKRRKIVSYIDLESDDAGPSTRSTRTANPPMDSDSDELENVSAVVRKESPVPQAPIIYAVRDDELIEDDNLQIFGETDPQEFSESSDDGHEDMPVRLLNNFVIYNLATCEMVHVGSLMQLNFGSPTEYGASGIVEAWTDDEDNDPEDDVEEDSENEFPRQMVKLSKIIEFNVHHVSHRNNQLDGKIYIRTKFSWYILDEPLPAYAPFFTQYWIQHRIFHLIVSRSLTEPRLTYDAFVQSLRVTPDTPDSIAISLKIIGRDLTVADLDSDEVKSYVLATLDDLQDQTRFRIDRVPLIRAIRGTDGDESLPSSPRRNGKIRREKPRPHLTNKEKDVLQHRNQTVVTPRVGRIAQRLFEQTLKVAGQFPNEHDLLFDEGLTQAIDDAKAHHLNPLSMKWLTPTEHEDYYHSVAMDGVVYTVGEVVMVCPGTDENQVRAKNAETKGAQTTNSLGNHLWFCKICYLFEKKGEKYFHGQWFVHGSKTVLQETAHPQGLFLTNACDNIPLASIFQKCNLRWLCAGEDEPPEDDQAAENDFFCSLVWDEKESSFVDLPTEREASLAISSCSENKPCFACGSVAQQENATILRPLPGGGFTQFDTRYHVADFIYVRTNCKDGRHEIAQITEINVMESPIQVSVNFLGRYDDFLHKTGSRKAVFDERRLYKSSKCGQISPENVDGICFVLRLTETREIDEWVAHDDHYYINQFLTTGGTLTPLGSSNFSKCEACFDDKITDLRRNKLLLAQRQPLRGLELFSGAGGLSTGLEMSGFVEARAAVEFSPSAAKTFALNHQNATVYNQCANLLLKHAIDCYEGKNPPPLYSLHDGKTRLEPMPKPGEIDFVFGGPPCQSFSGANRWKKANDVRSTLICNMLSYVEFYQPSHFQLENVIGLLQFPLNGRQAERSVVDGIKMGVVKFIERSLIGLGYQVRVKVLQAGQYGAPQSRKRVIFWGAKRGTLLPHFPKPTHAFQASFFYKLPTGDTLPPVTRSKDPHNYHQTAPLSTVTVNDAIGDLPGFDWESPHEIIRASRQDKDEVIRREKHMNIPSFDADRQLYFVPGPVYPGYPDPVRYALPPQTRYQKRVRSGSRDTVTYHYTRRFNNNVIERSWNVPLRGNADHTDLPLQLQPRRFDGQLVPKAQLLYGRIDAGGFFQTALTTVGPNAKCSRLLHPTQKRILTVRECARAQGFPDHYQFASTNEQPNLVVEDQHRQIGNAVPVPLALALGKALGESLLKMWDKEDREGSIEV